MAKKGRRPPRRTPHRPPPRRTDRPGRERADFSDQPLLQTLRHALRSAEPVDLLMTVSSLLEATDPRTRDPFAGDEAGGASRTDLIESFLDASYAETTATLMVIRTLVPDELLGARIRRELAARPQPMPPWLRGLDQARIEPEVWFLTHVLGDGDDYLLGATLPSGDAISALVYVDHNMGTVVKDAFVVGVPLDELIARMRSTIDDDQSLTTEDPAGARAIVEQAIDLGARMYPPLTSDTWPACRPLVEWLLRALPAGGTVPERKSWSKRELAQLADDFFASRFGAGLDHPDERDLFESLTWFGTDYVTGDPLTWSPVTVEMLLADWFPRKVVGEPSYLAKLPELVRAYVRYCHDRLGIPPELTTETLNAVSQWEPEYQRLIRTDRPQGAHALLDRMLAERRGEDFDVVQLERAVGGRLQLQALDDRPLPDEPFEWAGIPEAARPQVEQMLEACDRCADELLDVEHRTAMRRFLSRAAVGDPKAFTRKALPARGAAAIAWVICQANESTDPYGPLTAQALIAWFGLKGSVAQRAEPLLRANGVNPHQMYEGMRLGTPDLLVARRRAALIAARDELLPR